MYLREYPVRHIHHGELQELKKGSVVFTDEILAISSIDVGVANYWYPQYLATVVIAVDREQTDQEIRCWNDLLLAEKKVGMSDQLSESRLLLSAISYGLEGEDYTFEQSSRLLASLYERGFLQFNDQDAPILLCFDYQAVQLNSSGRSLEIIIPADGTFTFEKGLLSAYPLSFPANREEILLDAGFRLPDGRNSSEFYPSDYSCAIRPDDPANVATIFDDTAFVLKRDVQKISSYLYSSDDSRSHQFFGLCFIILVILWTGYVLRRVMQNGIRRAILIVSILVVGWMMLRMFKYQIPLGAVNRCCWYGYYFFRLSLPVTGIWLSFAIDCPNNIIRPPKWWYACAAYNFILIALILTNNLHHQAFFFNSLDPNYHIHFSYGPVYYIATISLFAEIFIIQVIIIRKGWKSPCKHGFFIPFVFYALIGFYCIGYVLRVPIIWETDSTMVNCIFVILFIDICIRSGLIPVNSKYKALFMSSPLNMQIMSSSGNVIIKSGAAAHRADDCSTFHASDENTLLYHSTITGGTVVWQEDIGSLNRLHQEISEINEKLKMATTMLLEEERIKSRLAATEIKTRLFSELENEIQKRRLELHDKIETLEQNHDYNFNMAVITLLLCYMKRRCILFFRERETPDIPLDEIVVYLDELSEFASFVGIRLHISSIMYDTLPTRQGTLFYDFVYFMLEWVLTQKRDTLLVQIISENHHLIAKSMCDEHPENMHIDTALSQAVCIAGGSITMKDMDDVMGIWLSFPEGGNVL